MMKRTKTARKTSPTAIKPNKVSQKINADLQMQKLKTYLSVKAVEYVLPVTGYVQQKLSLLQQKLNKA